MKTDNTINVDDYSHSLAKLKATATMVDAIAYGMHESCGSFRYEPEALDLISESLHEVVEYFCVLEDKMLVVL